MVGCLLVTGHEHRNVSWRSEAARQLLPIQIWTSQQPYGLGINDLEWGYKIPSEHQLNGERRIPSPVCGYTHGNLCQDHRSRIGCEAV